MENRAAVFTSKPQAVEVYQAGAWWAGELLGWRHAADGSCQVWVRVVLGGVEETAWTDLETLRLPERHLAMAPEPASIESARAAAVVTGFAEAYAQYRRALDAWGHVPDATGHEDLLLKLHGQAAATAPAGSLPLPESHAGQDRRREGIR